MCSEFVSIQTYYNIIYRKKDREQISLTKKHDIALTLYTHLANGAFRWLVGTTSVRKECYWRVRTVFWLGLNEFSD